MPLALCLEGISLTGVWLEKSKYRCPGLPIVTISCGAHKDLFTAGSVVGLIGAGSFEVLQLFREQPRASPRLTAGAGLKWLHRGEPEAFVSPVATLWTRALAGHLARFLPLASHSQGTVVAPSHLCSTSACSFTSRRLSGPDSSAVEDKSFQ